MPNQSGTQRHGKARHVETTGVARPVSQSWYSSHLRPFPWAVVSVIWCGLAVVEVCLQIMHAGSALRSAALPAGARLALVCYELVLLSGLVLSFAAMTLPTVRHAQQFPPPPSKVLRAFNPALFVFVWILLLLYAASWAKFWHTGRFLSHVDIAFVAPHPIQIFHWIGIDVVAVIVGASAIGALAFGWLIPRWIVSLGSAARAGLVRASATAIGLVLFGAIIGELYSGLEKRQWTRSGILYASSRDQSGGPLAFAFSGVRRLAGNSTQAATPSADLHIIQRPVIPMSQYVAGLDDPQRRWNVILLMIESLGANQLRSYGGTRQVMPAVEALARESRVFLNAYTQASHTDYATLVPLSSHYPLRSTAVYEYPRNPTYPRVLIYDVLKALGYRTAMFSSSNEYWAGMINYLQTGNLDRLFHAATFNGPTYTAAGDTGFAAWLKETKHAGSVDDRFTMTEALEWLGTGRNEPFFLYLNLQNSHLPYTVPDDFPRRFSSEQSDFAIRFGHVPPDKVEHVKNVYADSLAYVDAQIARLFEHLRRHGLWEQTVIVVTGDHGQAFNEHGFSAHAGPIYNEVMKVPLIVRAPGLSPGTDPRLAQHADIAPTLLDLLALPAHPSFQGTSLLEENPEQNRSIYLVAQSPQAHQLGIVRDRHKLIYDQWQQRYELYDLVSDAAEKHDLARQQPALVKELGGRLQAWRKLQLDYYADKNLHKLEYPPILKD